MNQRLFLSIALFAAAAAAALPVRAISFAINEGTTYRTGDADIQHKYKTMADELSHLTGQKVTIVAVSDYKELAEGLAAGRYELAYVHPAHIAVKALAVDGYKLVALTKGYTEYRAHFLVRHDSPTRSPADLKGRKLGAPAADSITSVLMRTTLRDSLHEGADQMALVNSRYQEAIPFMVEHGLVDAGVTGSESVAKAWTGAGGRIAFSSKPVPVKIVLASRKMPADELAKVQGYFVGLDQSEKGKHILESIDKTGFLAFDDKALIAVHPWLAAGVK